MTGPMAGVRIMEIGDGGEVTGLLLAAGGADVIRLELPGGSPGRRQGPFIGDQPGLERSLHHAYLNAGKRGITLDPFSGDGAAIWRRLLEQADVVIDSTAPDELDEGGVGHEAFQSLIDDGKLIWARITPFGLTGPWRDWASTDLIQIALGGTMMSSGYDDHDLPPIRPDGEHSLWMSGEFASMGILAALIERESSGLGQLIDVSVHECVSTTVEGAFPNWEYQRKLNQRQTGRHSSPTITAPWQYLCSDGRYVQLTGGGIPRTKGNWDGLMDWLDEFNATEDLRQEKYEKAVYSDPNVGTEERSRVAQVVSAFVMTRPSEEIYRRGQSLHLSYGPIRLPHENLLDPHWQQRGTFGEIEIPGHGTAQIPIAPYRFSETPMGVQRRAPMLGEHNYEIYHGDLGLDATQLVALAGSSTI